MPSQQFITELSQTPISELADILIRYVRESCAMDPASAVHTLASAVYSALPDDKDADPPRLLKVADFMKEIGDPPPSLVPDFLPAKKLICLSGAAKQGKSLVGLEFLHSISTGQQLMGRFPLEETGTVAYFGLEDGGHEIKSRLMQRGIVDIDNFYVCWQSFDMSSPIGFETFKRLVNELPEPPSLIIIDTAREAFKIRDWNDASLVSAAISPVRQWAQKNCSVILITHNNKDKFATGVNKISGSGALVSSCDCYMILENQKVLDNGDLRWDWEMAGRGMKTTKYVLLMDTNNLHIRILGGEEVESAKQEDRVNARLTWYAKVGLFVYECDEHRATIKMVSEALDIKYDFASTLMQEMKASKEINKTDALQYNPMGRPAPLYELSTKGAQAYLFACTPLTSEDRQVSQDDNTEDF